jgi:RND family efflux transporter MFP subunit
MRAAQSLGLLALVGAAVAGSGCRQGKPAGPAAMGPPDVTVAKAVLRDVLDYEEFTGRTEAVKTIVIRSRVTGYLDEVLFKDGDFVTEGTLLFKIDPRRLEAAVTSAEAAVAQAEAHLHRLDDDLRRAKNLIGTKALSREDYDKIAGDRAEADAALRKARADRDQAVVDRDYTRIRAPISGRISRRFIDPHNLVKADDTALTTIVSTDPIYAYFDVDERTELRLNHMAIQTKGDSPLTSGEARVQIGLANEPGYPHEGTLNFRDNQLDVGTGTMRYRCSIPNPKGEFTPGLFVRIKMPIGVPGAAVLVPEKAIGTDQGQKFVYVVDKTDDVVYRPVTVGALQESWRVIKRDPKGREGVAPGERVIISGLQRVRPGVRVQATEEKAPAAK